MPDIDFSIINPSQNPQMANYIAQRVDGRQMKALKVKYESADLASRIPGATKPATLLNFNPVCLRMEGGVDWKIPTFTDPSYPPQDLLHVDYKGKRYKATRFTVNAPKLYTQITDVYRKESDDMADGVGVYDVRKHQPIEIMFAYWALYNGLGGNASNMGGCLVWEGTRRDIEPKPGHENDPIYINWPRFRVLPDRTPVFYTEPRLLDEALAEVLDRQRVYCDSYVNQANQFHAQGGVHADNITIPHRIWHQYQLDMGWASTPQPWLHQITEATETCRGCGAPRNRALAYLCKECGRPYNAFEAYMGGDLPITSVYMNHITDPEEWEKVRVEAKRRRARLKALELDEGEEEQPQPKTKGKRAEPSTDVNS